MTLIPFHHTTTSTTSRNPPHRHTTLMAYMVSLSDVTQDASRYYTFEAEEAAHRVVRELFSSWKSKLETSVMGDCMAACSENKAFVCSICGQPGGCVLDSFFLCIITDLAHVL